MRKKFLKILFFSLCSILTLVVTNRFEYSQAEEKILDGLLVSPSVVDIVLNPQDSVDFEITIQNGTQYTLVYSPKIKAFRKDEFNNNITFITTKEEKQAEEWVFFDNNDIEMEPGETVKLPIEIVSPISPYNGSYYLALILQEKTIAPIPDETKVRQNIASTFLINIDSGKLREDAQIVYHKSQRSIITNDNLKLESLILNKGNSYIQPQGVVEISSVWGNGETVKKDFNPEKLRILQDSKRVFSMDIELDNNSFGKFQTDIYMVYGLSNKVLVSSSTFYVIPWYFLISAAILILFFMILISYRFILVRIRQKNV